MKPLKYLALIAAAGLVAVAITPGTAQDRDPIPVQLRLVAQGVTSPLWLTSPPDGTHRRFVVDQAGFIWIIQPDDTLLAQPFLDLRSKMVTFQPQFDERGLLGLAFHPDYANNGRFFVFYSAPLRAGAPANWNCTSTVSEFHVSGKPNVADPNSERIVLRFDKPQFNHNGGALGFGPDGYLYISAGDGGAGNDMGLGHNPAIGNGQDIHTMLGKIMRIDVDGAQPYGIPGDNPFVGIDGLDEIYAYGFRNPYRMSFDTGGAHNLFVSDAGQNLWEEVSIVHKGGNYGWRLKEGTHGFDPASPNVSPPAPTVGYFGEPLMDPIIEYPNINFQPGIGVVVVGGVVYRGSDVPQLRGRYIFADWSKGFVPGDGTLLMAQRVGPPFGDGIWPWRELQIKNHPNQRVGAYINGFGQDDRGEVYVLTNSNLAPVGNTGKIYKLARPGGK